ncbi:MAG: AAA family ATPase [Elusimicrobia bacterium]|nr:AAA family ATPase [Elusimicrobiota bacterium]
MRETRFSSTLTRIVVRFLVAALILSSPGVHPYRAFAQTVSGSASGVRVPVSVALPTGGAVAPAAAPLSTALVPAALTLGRPIAPVTRAVSPARAPAATAAAQPVSAAVAAAVAGLAPAAKDAERPKASGDLVRAARPAAQLGTGANETSAETVGRPFEGSSVRPVAGGDAVSGLEIAGRESGLSQDGGFVLDGAAELPAPAVAAPSRWWSSPRARAMGAALGLVGLTVLLREAAPAAIAAVGMAAPYLWGGLLSGGEPEGRGLERFGEFIGGAHKPGDAITPAAAREAARRAGIDEEKAETALLRLPEGAAVPISGGNWLYLGFDAPSDAPAPALALAQEGLRKFRALKWQDHLLAVAYLEEATRQLEQHRRLSGQPSSAGGAIQQLKGNAYLKILGELAGVLAKAAERNNKPDLHAPLTRASNWARLSFFARSRVPETMDGADHRVLMGALRELKIDFKGDPAMERYEAALAAVRAFAEGVGPEDGETPAASKTTALVPVSKSAPAAPSPDTWLIKANDEKYQNLHKYGVNLTRLAVENSPEIPRLIGRREQIRQIVKTLLRVEKNNPLIVGDKGVGKTAIAKGLARLIADHELPELEGKNVFKLDVGAIIAGTKFRGEFEERMKSIINEAKASKGKVVLFIDEIHNIMGLGEASGAPFDAANMLKEALSTGEISIIGATTFKEARHIEKDEALARRFNFVKVPVPTIDEAIDIANGVKGRYEAKHGVTIGQDTVEAAVKLGARYVTDRNLPDSALDLLDDASAEVELRVNEAKRKGEPVPPLVVTPDHISFEIALRTGIPAHAVSADDLESLKRLPDDLKENVIGQDEAISAVARAVRRGRLGYKEAKEPVGTFLFLGPTGVGKTEVARVVAKTLFRSEKNIVRIDMSEYQEKHSVSRLISAPPGYVGYEDGGILTEAVRRNPYTVVLLDEIEKAHPEVLDVLLQVIEDGRLTDGHGRVVDFSNVVLIMTSNIGGSEAYQVRRKMGFVQRDEPETRTLDRNASYLAALKAAVKPEFFNRVGKRNVVVFNELSRLDIEKILNLRLKDLQARIAGRIPAVRLTDTARLHLVDEATNAENRVYGARPIKQAINIDVLDAIVDAELEKRVAAGDRVLVDWDAAASKYVARKDGDPSTHSMGGFAAFGLPLALGALSGFAFPAAELLVAGIGLGLFFAFRAWSARTNLVPGANAPPAASPLLNAAGRVSLMAGAFLALDWGVKWAMVAFGLPVVYHAIVPTRAAFLMFAVPMAFISAAYYLALVHAKQGPAQWIEKIRRKHPVLATVVKGALEVLLFPVGLGEKRFVGDLVERYPVIRKLTKVADVAIAALLAAALGNGVEGLVNGRVVDFIPFGHSHANIADFLVFLGAPLLWMTLDFFGEARKAEQLRQPARLKTWKYYVMPILAIAVFQLSTTAGLAAVPLAAWYGMLFGVLFGLGVLASNVFLDGKLAEFNRAYRPTDSAGAKLAPVAPRLSLSYRLRKRAAALLASLGLGVGAPRLTAQDYDALVDRFREAPPKVVILDYDDTFLDNSDGKGLVITPERIALLERLAAANIRVAFATNRPLEGKGYGMTDMMMDRLPEALRRNFIISTGGGAEVYQYGPNGEKPAAPVKSNPLTAEELAALERVMAEETAKLGLTPLKQESKGYEFSAVFAAGEKRVRPLFAAVQKAVKRSGYDFSVTLKAFDDDPKKAHLEPYIRISKSSKTMAVNGILELLAAEGARPEPEDVVMIGDDFTVPGFDSAMARALPQGTALAVGKGADARLDNVYLLPEVGPEQTVDFLKRVSR